MSFVFSKRSLNNLKGVHPKLVELMTRVLAETPYDFIVTEGLRTLDRQIELKAQGKSQTLKSYHMKQRDGYGHAVDLAALVPNGKGKSEVSWELEPYREINKVVQRIAADMGIKVTWGGTWKTLVDSPHWQLETSA